MRFFKCSDGQLLDVEKIVAITNDGDKVMDTPWRVRYDRNSAHISQLDYERFIEVFGNQIAS